MADPLPNAQASYTPEEIQAAQQREAAGVAQAEAQRQAYLTNTAPILPKNAPGGGAQYTEAQQADATREAAKHMEAFHPEQFYGVNPAALGNMSQEQIASRYGERMAEHTSSYFYQNPSSAYQEQVALYSRNIGTVATGGDGSYRQGSFIPTVAAGAGGFTGRAAEYKESWTPLTHSALYGQESTVERTSIIAPPSMADITISPGRSVYVPIGEMEQQLRTDAKIVFSGTGAYEIWQTPKNTMPGSDFTRIYPMITAGGSDYALQSGMISGKAQTPWVVDEYGMNPLWKESASARVADIQANPENYSRLGSELYGGIVQKLAGEPYNTIELAWGRGQTVEPGVYPAVRQNYASLVNFEDVNAPKGTVSNAADLPKFGAFTPEEYAAMPNMQRVAIGGELSPATSMDLLPQPFRSTSSPAVVGTTSTSPVAYATPAEVSQAAGKPATPFTVFGPEVEAWGMGATKAVAASIFPPAAIAVAAYGSMQSPAEAAPVPGTDFVYRTDPAAVAMEGALYYGDTLLFGLATPGKDLLKSQGQAENTKLDTFNTDFAKVTAQRETYTALGSTIETQRMGLDKMLEGKINAQGQFTGTASEYTQYQTSLADLNANVAKYNQYGDQYKDVLSKGFASGAIIKSGEGFIANPDNEHPYGAFSDWSASVTKTLRGGVTESDIIRYEQTPEFKAAGPVTWFGEGAWKAATKPTELAAAGLQGVEIYATMGLADVGLAAVGARGAAMGGAGGGALETAGFGGQKVLQSGAFQYGLGGVLVAGSVWSATEGFTAPAEQAWSRGGELTTNLVAMGWGGLSPEGVAVATRGIGFPNFGIIDTMAGRGGGATYRTGPDLPPGPPGGPTGGSPPSGPTGGSPAGGSPMGGSPIGGEPMGGGPMGGGPMGGGPAPAGGWSFTDFTNPIGRQSRVFNSNIEDWYRPAPTEGGGAAALPMGETARPSVEWTFAKEIPMSQEPAALPSGAPSYNIRRVFDEAYVPPAEKLPSMSEDMFTAGSALDVGAQRLIATSETGQVVGATAFEVRGNEIFVKSMGSRQAGVGTAMTQELTDIAGRYGATKITGESRPQAVGFWEKMGADVMVPEGGKGAYPFEIRVGGETPLPSTSPTLFRSIGELPEVAPGYTRIIHQTSSTSLESVEPFLQSQGLKYKYSIDTTSNVLGGTGAWKEPLADMMAFGRGSGNIGRYGDTITIFDVKSTDYRLMSDVTRSPVNEQNIGFTGEGTYVGKLELSPYGPEAPARIAPSVRPVAESPVPGSATNMERIQYALRYNEPQKTIDAMEYIRGRYPEQEAIWERYATDIQQLEPMKPGRGQELQPQPETIDLRQTTDLRPYAEPRSPLNIPTKMEFDLTNTQVIENPTRYVDRYATPTEREMIFQQYEFTPAEIEFAKLNKASLNDVLARRESMAQPMQPMEPMRAMEPMRGTYGTQEPARVFETTSREDYLLGYSRENYLQGYSREFEIFGTIPDTIGRTVPSEDYARAFKMSDTNIPDTIGKTDTMNDYARKFGTVGAVASATMVGTASAQDFARTFGTVTGPSQSPIESPFEATGGKQITTPDQTGGGGGGGHWIRGWETPTPPPPTPPFLPLGGSIGGQGPGLGGKKRGSRKYLEYFPVGLDISTFGVQRGANPFTSGLGRLKYLPRDVGVVSTPGVARERSSRLLERKIIAMKAIPVKGKKGKNIFMQ